MYAETTSKETPTVAPESDPLEEISVNAARVIREALAKSREAVIMALKLVDGIRNKPVVADGTQESLKTLAAKLGEVEELYIKVFASVTRTYGDDPSAVISFEDQDNSTPTIIGPVAEDVEAV